MSGRPPLRLLDGGHPDTWNELDLEILSQYKAIKDAKCPGCGRPLSQHLYNSRLGREETPDDYTPHTVECPALQAVAGGQAMWRDAFKGDIDRFNEGKGPDPSQGVFWLSQGQGEALPQPVEE